MHSVWVRCGGLTGGGEKKGAGERKRGRAREKGGGREIKGAGERKRAGGLREVAHDKNNKSKKRAWSGRGLIIF